MSQYAPCHLTGQAEIPIAAERHLWPLLAAVLTYNSRKSYNPYVGLRDRARARFLHSVAAASSVWWSNVYDLILLAARNQPMSIATTPARSILTPYEAEVVQEIATWKSRPRNPIAELFDMVAMPVADLVEKVIPDNLVQAAIAISYNLSDVFAGQEDIKRQAGVRELGDLLKKPLEQCDRLAVQVGFGAQAVATVEGAATGAGGVLTTLIDIPLMFVLALRTIIKIGHCYGYPLDRERDRHFVLGILIAASSSSVQVRRRRLEELKQIEHMLLEETQEEIIAEEALSLLFQLEIFEEVPGVGMISGALLNLFFIRRVDRTARHVFQERWLGDNGKVHVIAPTPVHERHLASGLGGAFGRVAYSGLYVLGYGAALPVHFAISLVRSIDNPLTRGTRVATT
jgi:hypothetical protein